MWHSKVNAQAPAILVGEKLLWSRRQYDGCGLQRNVYFRSLEGEATMLEFTIAGGKVTEIFEDFGG
jgi:hypothetical protein